MVAGWLIHMAPWVGIGRTLFLYHYLPSLLFAFLALAWLHGDVAMREPYGGETIRIAVVQPNISAEKKWDARFKHMSFDALGDLTLEAAAHDPDLVIWPETAAPSYLLSEPADLELVAGIARTAGVDILTGCPSLNTSGESDSAVRTYNSNPRVLLRTRPRRVW